MTGPTVDVVTVAFESRATLSRCLSSVAGLPELGQVVVIDHGDDGSGELAAEFGATVVLDPSNPGFGAGQNRGVGLARAPYVLLVNPDAEVVHEGIMRGIEILTRHDDVAVVQGQIVNRVDGRTERSQGVELGVAHLLGRALGARRLLAIRPIAALASSLPRFSDHVARVPNDFVAVETLAATAWLIRRAAFDQVGGFSASYFLYGEDLDLCRRLRAAGWRLIATPDLWARHDGGGSSAGWWQREIEWWRGTMHFAATWWPAGRFLTALLVAVVRWVTIAVLHPPAAGPAWSGVVAHAARTRWSGAGRSLIR